MEIEQSLQQILERLLAGQDHAKIEEMKATQE
jgi:hypothetical protein